MTAPSEHARNIAIVLALGAIVWLLPGGGDGAALINQFLSAAFMVAIALFLARMYQQFRTEILDLGQEWRLILYGAVGVLMVTLAASTRLFETPGGAFLWIALIAASIFAIVRVYRHSRDWAY